MIKYNISIIKNTSSRTTCIHRDMWYTYRRIISSFVIIFSFWTIFSKSTFYNDCLLDRYLFLARTNLQNKKHSRNLTILYFDSKQVKVYTCRIMKKFFFWYTATYLSFQNKIDYQFLFISFLLSIIKDQYRN